MLSLKDNKAFKNISYQEIAEGFIYDYSPVVSESFSENMLDYLSRIEKAKSVRFHQLRVSDWEGIRAAVENVETDNHLG